ncbi:Inositol-1-monophosphatase [invertebrate metagenome]|uniref:inositol-phosphate phosphatase n=1 Tax=invertebrate metagenome TaxID=1711999 RepID=A0A484HBW7_9ZZZZ
MAYLSPTLNVMLAAAKKAGRGLARDFGEVEQLQVSLKGTNDFMSTADLKAEQTLHRELKKARPDFGFLLEESGAEEGRDKDNRWIIDPLDGTINFLHGIPHFSISIALERCSEIVAGVIYHPVADELYYAEKGNGTYLNDRRLRVSARRRIEEALFATGIPFLGRPAHGQFLAELQAVMAHSAGVRRMGSAALDLAYVAAGRYDGYWERNLSPWDVAAGCLIVREAGGYVSEVGGGRNPVFMRSILATNDHLYKPLGDLLQISSKEKSS